MIALTVALNPWVQGIFAVLLLVFVSRHQRYKLPPGPPGLPILGNFLDIPKAREWLTYNEWSRKYGSDIIHLRILETHIVVVNTTKAAQEIFEKRSRNYSDKVESVMVHELTGWGRNMAFMGYSDSWRMHRRMFHQYFRPQAIPTYHSNMTKGVRKGLNLLLQSPDSFAKHVRFMAGATILDVVYGLETKPENDPRVKLVEEAVQVLAQVAAAGAYLVDYMPILKHIPTWFPGAKFKRDAAEWKPMVDEMFIGPYTEVKAAYDQHSARPCVLTSIFESFSGTDVNDDIQDVIINVTGLAYAAGTDTTVSTLLTFILAMLLYPDVQAAAQKELDDVVGRSRLPDIDDRDSLPYISAILNEVLRWRPAFPLAVPHQSVEDDEYEGYHIPAGSVVVGNTWAILHDENRYPDPEIFNPTRFLTPEGMLDSTVPEPIETFGFSRRICAGRYFALDMSWLAIANILAAFSITKPVNKEGHVIEPTGIYTSGFLCLPEPYLASFNPRYDEVADLILSDSVMVSER